MNEQTASAADDQVTPDPQALTGEPDLEALLAEGQKALETPAPKVQPETDIDKKKLDFLYDDAKNRNARETLGDTKSAIADISKALKSDGVELSDKAMGRQILGFASENPLFNQAFEQRHENPKAWDAAQKLAVKEIGESFGETLDTNIGNDREAALLSVRNQSSVAPKHGEKYGADSLKGLSGADIIRLSYEMAAANKAKR